MKKDTLYKIIILVLLLLNSFLLIQMIGGRGPRRGDPKMRAVKMLHLDEGQRVQFDSLVDINRMEMHVLMDSQSILVARYMQDTSELTLEQIGNVEERKVIRLRQHFVDVRSILKPDQYKYYEVFEEKGLQHILGNPPRGRHRKP